MMLREAAQDRQLILWCVFASMLWVLRCFPATCGRAGEGSLRA
jgi:hypothetical protein